MKTRTEILEAGIKLTTGDRQETHGDFVANHEKIAELWSVFLGVKIHAWQVAICMTLVKVARTVSGGKANADDFLDGSVYTAGAWECYYQQNKAKLSSEANKEALGVLYPADKETAATIANSGVNDKVKSSYPVYNEKA